MSHHPSSGSPFEPQTHRTPPSSLHRILSTLSGKLHPPADRQSHHKSFFSREDFEGYIFEESSGQSTDFSLITTDLPTQSCLAPPNSPTEDPDHEELFCEFVGLSGCYVAFKRYELWPWIQHIEEHLHGQLPERCKCWFCDVSFTAKENGNDRQKAFHERMMHICQHITDGLTVKDMRPDFDMIEHLYQQNIMDESLYRRARMYEEGPVTTGTYAHDFIPPEQLEAAQRGRKLEVRETREERRARMVRQRQRREENMPHRQEVISQKVKESQQRQTDNHAMEDDQPNRHSQDPEAHTQVPKEPLSSCSQMTRYLMVPDEPEEDALPEDQTSHTFSTGSDSLTDQSEEDTLPEDHPFQPHGHPIRQATLSEFVCWIKEAGNSGQRKTESGPPTSSPNGGQSFHQSNKSRKRLRGDNSGDKGGQDEDRKGKKPKEEHPEAGEDGPILACPFYKRSQARYSNCLHFRLKRIKDVKQHLLRKHKQPHYCPVCGLEFETQQALQDHTVARSCEYVNVTKPEGVSEDQRVKLSDRVSRTLTISEQWFAIWNILFPTTPRPASPLVECPIHEVLSSFREFWDERGQGIISEHLQRDKEILYSMPREERDLRALHSMLFHETMGALVDRFIHQFSDDSTSGSRQSVPTPSSNDAVRTESNETSIAPSSREEPEAQCGTGTRLHDHRTAELTRRLAPPESFDDQAPGPSFPPSAFHAPDMVANVSLGHGEPEQLLGAWAGDPTEPIDWQPLDCWMQSLVDLGNKVTENEDLLDFT